MPTITLKDVYEAINRLEDKLDRRITILEARQDVVESKVDMMMGKVGVFVALITLTVSATITLTLDWLKKTFIK